MKFCLEGAQHTAAGPVCSSQLGWGTAKTMTASALIDVAEGTDDAILRIWDELSDSAASDAKRTVGGLLEALCAISGASNATWAGAVRVGQKGGSDPLEGWRVAAMQAPAPAAPSRPVAEEDPERRFRKILKKWDRREIDESFLLPLRGVGTFRTYGFRRDLPAAWFSSPFYRTYYEAVGTHDAVFVAFPLNHDCESHFGFYAATTFPEGAIARLATTLRAVKWFHRRLLLSHGLLVASSPLTPTEREVLGRLLAGGAEKEIALNRGIAASTVHQHVLGIYRKFGVGSRAELMALWLNQPA